MLTKRADDEVNFAVELYSFCSKYRTLPQAGGVLDQDAYYMQLLRLVDSAVQEREKLEQDKREAEQKWKAKAGKR